MVWLLAWLPLSGTTTPGMPQQDRSVAYTDMPCHSHAPLKTTGFEKHCNQPRPACECCDQAAPASLPSTASAPLKPHYLRVLQWDEPFVHAPEPPFSQRYRPPRA